MIGRVLIACAIVVVSSRMASAQDAAAPPPLQLQAAPPPVQAAPPPVLAAPGPPPYPARPVRTRSMILAELTELEAQRREYSLALPIGLLIGGGLATLNGVVVLLIGLIIDGVCDNYVDYDYPYDTYDDDDCAADDLADVYIIGGSIAAGVGAVLLIVGGTLLGNRSGPRRELGDRIKALRRELQWSVAGLPLSVEPLANGAAVQLRF